MSHHAAVMSFNVLFLFSAVLLVCTLLPAIFSRTVQRSLGWYNLMIAWLVYTLGYLLAMGKQEGVDRPSSSHCLVQTLVIYSAQPLAASSTLCYFIEFYLIISSVKSSNLERNHRSRTRWLVATPWLVFLITLGITIGCIFTQGGLRLVSLTRGGFYCHILDTVPGPHLVTTSLNAAAIVILLPLEVWTGITMYRNWSCFKRLSQADRHIFLTVYVRFILVTLSALIISALSARAFGVSNPDTGTIVVLYPLIPIFIALAFGTQKDIIHAWLFWRKPSETYNPLVFHHHTLVVITTSSSSELSTQGLSQTPHE